MTRPLASAPDADPPRGIIPVALPLPAPPAQARIDEPLLFAASTIDVNGRVADRTCVRALSWPPGSAIRVDPRPGLLVVTADPRGRHRIDRRGRLRIRSTERQLAQVQVGAPVVLIAASARGVIVIGVMSAIATLVVETLLAPATTASPGDPESTKASSRIPRPDRPGAGQ